MSKFEKIIFLSDGGTCRSIVAKAIFDKYKTDEVEAEARGMVVLFPEPINPKAVAVAKAKGIEIQEKQSTPIEADDFGENTLVLVMTEMLKKQVYEKFETAVNVYSIREYVGEALDVESPFGGELNEYAASFDYLETLIKKLVSQDD